jgi:hypothetical protein
VTLPAAHGYPSEAAATPDLSTVVVTGEGTLTAWRTATGETTTVRLAAEPATATSSPGSEAGTLDVAIDVEGCHALGADSIGRAHIWDIRTGRLTVVQADPKQVQAVAGLAGHRGVTAGIRGTATVWDLTRAQPICAAPLDSPLTAATAEGFQVLLGDNVGNAHLLVLLQGDPTPPAPPTPPEEKIRTAPSRPSLLHRLLRKH